MHTPPNEFGFCDNCTTALYPPKRFWITAEAIYTRDWTGDPLAYSPRRLRFPFIGTDEWHRYTVAVPVPFTAKWLVVAIPILRDGCPTC